MPSIPPIPAWEALHPAVVHFPAALFIIVPLFVVIGAMLRPERARPWLLAALVLMAIGSAMTFVAIETGEAAEELVERDRRVEDLLHEHEEAGEMVRNVFTGLTVLYALVVLVPFRRPPTRLLTTVLPLAVTLLWLGGLLFLADAADKGARIVHEFGLSAQGIRAGHIQPVGGGGKDRED